MSILVLDPAAVLHAIATATDAEFLATDLVAGANLIQRRLAVQWAANARSISPLWRSIAVKDTWNVVTLARGGGTSIPATMAGAGALAIAGVSVAVAVGVWVALGAGLYEARKRVRARGFLTGFSRGFVMGVLNWKWQIAASRFLARRPYLNAMDQTAGMMEAAANNDGLFIGFCLGASAPEEKKKLYRTTLRRLAGRVDDAAWSKDAVVARNQQIDYVVALAGAGVRQGLLVAE